MKVVLSIIVLVASIIGLILLLSRAELLEESQSVGGSINGKESHLVGRNSEQNHVGVKASSEQVLYEHRSVLWQVSQDTTDASIPRPPPNPETAVLISLNRNQLDNLLEDDEFTVLIPQQNIEYDFKVETINRLASGNVVISGVGVAPTEPGNVLITLSERSTYVTLNVPTGNFSVRGNTELAWLVSRDALRSHIDENVPDYVVRDRRVQRQKLQISPIDTENL